MGIAHGPLRDWYGALMFTNDGVKHDRLRRLVSKAFTPRAVGRLRAVAAARVAERLDGIRDAGGGDLVRVLADVPMHVMCSLVGVPAEDVPEFLGWVDALSPVFGFMEPAQIATATDAIGKLLAYVRDLRRVAQRHARRRPDDVADPRRARRRSPHARGDGRRWSRTCSSADTTPRRVRSAARCSTLLARPQVLAELRAEPALLPSLVNETIRFEPSITGAPRTVAEPIEICGVLRAPPAPC